MKAIVLLFTATLFVVCSAFPTVGGQQSNEFCTTLAYPQDAPAAYVHLCYTPGKGITRILNFVTIPDFLLVCTCVLSMCSPCKCNLLSRAGFASGSLFSVLHILLFFLLDYYCRYLYLGIPSKMFTLQHAERNCSECDTPQ